MLMRGRRVGAAGAASATGVEGACGGCTADGSGDWTATGWPSTMEGAVRSGRLAARAVLPAVGLEAPPLTPDLPRGLLARAILGS